MQKDRLKLVVGLILVVLAIIVVLQNTMSVETKILFITLTMPQALLLFLTLLVGIVLGILIALHFLGKKRDRKNQ
ncbi:MAG: lipopolysaccharide assembly protein LapA domain-containing protein [Desulfurivibrionaceae bacterium]